MNQTKENIKSSSFYLNFKQLIFRFVLLTFVLQMACFEFNLKLVVFLPVSL